MNEYDKALIKKYDKINKISLRNEKIFHAILTLVVVACGLVPAFVYFTMLVLQP